MIPYDEMPVVVVIEQPGQVVNDAARPDPLPKPTDLPKGWAAGQWDRFSLKVERSARCIAHHESWTAGLWTARNPSSASGFAQWLDSTWRTQTKRAGVGTQYARAFLAPPKVQAEVFAFQAEHFGLYPWVGTQCPGT